MKGNHRVLSDEQIEEGKKLRREEGYTKSQLAELFDVGETTIWENIFSQTKRVRIYLKKCRVKRVCIPCAKCEKCLTNEIEGEYIPHSFQVGDTCLSCYLRGKGLHFKDIL